MKQQFQLLPVHHDVKKLQGTMNDLSDAGYEYLDCVRRTQGQMYIIMAKEVADDADIHTKSVDPESLRTQDDYDQIRISRVDDNARAEEVAKSEGYSIKNRHRTRD